MTGAEALLKVHAMPEHIGDHVLTLLSVPMVYQAQLVLARQFGAEEGNAILAALVKARWSALQKIHNRN